MVEAPARVCQVGDELVQELRRYVQGRDLGSSHGDLPQLGRPCQCSRDLNSVEILPWLVAATEHVADYGGPLLGVYSRPGLVVHQAGDGQQWQATFADPYKIESGSHGRLGFRSIARHVGHPAMAPNGIQIEQQTQRREEHIEAVFPAAGETQAVVQLDDKP
ncbi:hypothetical protein [Streptomyces globisporus]|uniref:hypothetical protein n=1 Tax=Streptomyces globisporus TaxID=1908 RepID=UPI0037BE037C